MTVTLAPSRAAYLVRAGNEAGFRRAVREASTRWGGITEPILEIRVGESPAQWAGLLSFANVDGLVNVDLAADEADAAAAELNLPWVPLSDIDDVGPLCWSTYPSDVGPLPPIERPLVVTTNGGSLWEIVAAGSLPSEQVSALRAQSNTAVSTPFRMAFSPDDVGRAQLLGGTWLGHTAAALGGAYGGEIPLSAPTTLWVTKGDDLEDSWRFWNFRALRSIQHPATPMYLFPLEEMRHWVGLDKQLAFVLDRPDDFSPDVVLTSCSASDPELVDIASLLGLAPATSKDVTRGGGFPTTAARRRATFTYLLWKNVAPFVMSARTYGTARQVDVHVFSNRATLDFDSPIEFRNTGRALVRIGGGPLDTLPMRDEVAALVRQGAIWKGASVQFGAEATNHFRMELRTPGLPEALGAVLSTAASSHRISDKGNLALRFATSETLLEPGVFDAIRRLTTPRSKEFLRDLAALKQDGLSPELEEFASRWSAQGRRTYRSRADFPEGQAWSRDDVLERLAAVGWAERGFEVRCQVCHTPSFLKLSDVSSRGPILCPACHTEQRLTERGAGPAVFYRLDGLVDRASDQGALPHVLASAMLKQHDPRAFILPGVDFELKDGSKREADLVGIYERSVIVGEVKTSGTQFTESQIEKDVALCVALTANAYVMAAPDGVPDATQLLAQSACRDVGMKLIVLEHLAHG